MAGESQAAFKLQNYQEEDGRIRVASAYAYYDLDFGANWTISVEGIYNGISGATPNGLLPETPGGPIPTDEIDDHREAVIVDLSTASGDWTFDLNVNAGQETDYKSKGAAFTLGREFNHKLTTATIAYGYTGDEVLNGYTNSASDLSIVSAPQNKHIHDVVAGLTQVIDKQTLLALNFGWSHQTGFLNDPYKLVQKDVEVFPGFFLPETYKENRPDARTRWIANARLNHRIEALHGSLEAAYRYTKDDWSVHTHTIGLTWFQDLGAHFILQPSVRWLRQSAADFYRLSLNEVDFDPAETVFGQGHYYAADHRLSEMQTLNLGLKLRWEVNDHLAFDFAAERYALKGLDHITPDGYYSKANVFTFGGTWRF